MKNKKFKDVTAKKQSYYGPKDSYRFQPTESENLKKLKALQEKLTDLQKANQTNPFSKKVIFDKPEPIKYDHLLPHEKSAAIKQEIKKLEDLIKLHSTTEDEIEWDRKFIDRNKKQSSKNFDVLNHPINYNNGQPTVNSVLTKEIESNELLKQKQIEQEKLIQEEKVQQEKLKQEEATVKQVVEKENKPEAVSFQPKPDNKIRYLSDSEKWYEKVLDKLFMKKRFGRYIEVPALKQIEETPDYLKSLKTNQKEKLRKLAVDSKIVGGNYYETQSSLFGLNNKKLMRQPIKGLDEMIATHDKPTLVEIRHMDITYGKGAKEFKAVQDLNLNIFEGEVLGLVGESGSGKSTIGRTIVGLTPRSFGSLKINGLEIPKKIGLNFQVGEKRRELKKIIHFMVNKVQMIFQDPTNSLNPYKNIYKNVAEGLNNQKNSRYLFLLSLDHAVLEKAIRLIKDEEIKKSYLKRYKYFLNTFSIRLEKSANIIYKQFYNEVLKDERINEKTLKKIVLFLGHERDKRNDLSNRSEKYYKTQLIIEMLHSVGLDEVVFKRYPLEFSGGQQQRIGICRSIILRPKLLVADEPISALDVSIQAQVVNIFNQLKKKYNLTILFIAHDLRMVEYISNRIAVMNKGILLEVGPTEQIMKNSLHPYTKSLLDAVPSIESKKTSLVGYVYNPKMHKYSELVQPEWINLGNDHFVLATPEEVEKWKAGDYN